MNLRLVAGKTAMNSRSSNAVRALLLRATCLVLSLMVVLAIGAQKASAAFEHPVILSANAIGDDNSSRIVLDFDQEVDLATRLLDHPWRLVLDFDRVGFGFDPKPERWSGLATDIRWGDMSELNSRIIFQMDAPFRILGIQQTTNNATKTHRIVIDVETIDQEQFKTALLDEIRTSAIVQQSTKSDRLGAPAGTALGKSDQFVVVLDPGHGGIDSGAVGRQRTLEKKITLAFANKLRTELEAYGGIKVLLTREADIFVPLNDRVRFARQNGASLFISLHADSVKEKYVRGATVYTISESASDSVAAQLAESENSADSIAGLSFEDTEDDVSDILIDLTRRETLGFSVQFARLTVASISEELRMIKNPHRHAGFRVLRAPDVPSVLVELGFLSNTEDEKLLRDPAWRWKVAKQIAKAVERFAAISGHKKVVSRSSQ